MIHKPRNSIEAPASLQPSDVSRANWEPILDRFEDAWLSGSPPRIDDFSPPFGADTEDAPWRELLVELIKIDLEYRWRTNSPRFRVEDYAARFPVFDPADTLSVDLIGEEYRVRQQWGDRPGHTEFSARFPNHADSVRAELGRIDAELAAEAAGREPEFMRDTPPESPRATEPTRPDGAAAPSLAGFEILETLGRGGMGVVYKARQLSLGRVVAIKMILAGEHASSHERARFRAEAESAAGLQHPNIVQVHEVGEHDGRPFCVLEFIDGGNLADRLAMSPLPPHDAAQLVRTLARAVQFAHGHGIVHRDLKPANVLLSFNRKPEACASDAGSSEMHAHASGSRLNEFNPKITDFGLAKRLDADGPHTQSGAMLGTPSYMAPEQAAGDGRAVGPTTDVYALGAILYESLVGRPPFRAATTLETLDQVRSHEPVAPSRLLPQVPRDLETISLKCLSKRADRRYASAAELADDLDRYLTNRPVRARRAGLVERAVKWSRRRPTTAAVAAVGLLATICLVAGGMIYNARLQAAARRADQQRVRADENFTRAFDAVNRMLDRVGFERLADVPEMEEVRRELLGEAIEFYTGLLANQDDPSLAARREYAGAYLRLGQIDYLLGQLDQAEAHIARSLDLYRRLVAEFPAEPKHQNGLALSRFHLGLVRAAANRRDEAEPEYSAAIAIWMEIERDFPDCRASLASACHDLAKLFQETRRFDRAEQLYAEALARAESLADADPENTQLQNSLASVHHNLGVIYRGTTGCTTDAEAAFRKAIAIWESLSVRCPRQSEFATRLAECYTAFAFLFAKEHTEQGDELLQKALARRIELAGRFPKVPWHQEAVARAQHNVGAFYQMTGRGHLAEPSLREAVTIRERLAVEFPQVGGAESLAESCNNLALALQNSGRASDARLLVERAIAILETLLREHPDSSRYPVVLAATLINHGILLRDSGDTAASLEALNRAVTSLVDMLRDHPDYSDAKQHLFSASGARAQTLAALGRHADSIADWDRVVDLADSPARGEYQVMRAMAMIRAGDPARAAAEADAIAANDTISHDLLYNVACVYSLAAAAMERDPTSPAADWSEHANALAQRAAGILLRLNGAGYFQDAAHRKLVESDPDLAAVRSARTWSDLLGQLDAK